MPISPAADQFRTALLRNSLIFRARARLFLNKPTHHPTFLILAYQDDSAY